MASSFMTPLDLRYDYEHDKQKPFLLLAPFIYDCGFLGSAIKILVPAGFRTDFASIPKMFQNILSPYGPYAKAAVVHDFLYNEGYVNMVDMEEGTEIHHTPTRKEADDTLEEAMEVLGVNWMTRQTIYWAVRLGGGSSFHQEAK